MRFRTSLFTSKKLISLSIAASLGAASCGKTVTPRSASAGAPLPTSEKTVTADANAMDEDLGFELTATQCSDAALINKITASPSGSLFINSPDVVNDPRAKGVGKWSFGYAMREILELPAPGLAPSLLLAEQNAINTFLNKFNQTAPVNGFVPSKRDATRSSILALWGKTRGSDGKDYLTFDKAPFKLLAIMNRLDIVKKGSTGVTAGEGRFVFGFTGPSPMTVILEYDLPIGVASNNGITSALIWAKRFQSLKNFLQDTNTVLRGVQPNQAINAPLAFTNKAGYLTALEGITEMWANRRAQKRTASVKTQSAISQIRTNEFISFPWELREISRGRSAQDLPILALTTVKNNPDQSFANGKGIFASWLESNITCRVAGDKNSCAYTTANASLPAALPDGMKLLGAAAPVDFQWAPNSTNIKHRFTALNTCSGCHQSETGTSFLHIDIASRQPSAFMRADLARRLKGFKNLVCLAAVSTGELNLAGEAENAASTLENLRIETSSMTH